MNQLERKLTTDLAKIIVREEGVHPLLAIMEARTRIGESNVYVDGFKYKYLDGRWQASCEIV